MKCRVCKVLAALASWALLLSVAAEGGPLTPPPGPVAPTNKTLQQVEPRTPLETVPGNLSSMHKITQPGSYYLTGNIALAAGRFACIEVGASGVTIDLNGFTLDGLNTGGSVAIRVEDGATASGVRVVNGHITNWDVGIAGLGFVALVVDSVRFSFCNTYGADVGTGASVTRCTAFQGGTGFYLRDGGTISQSSASFFGRGFDLGNGAVASDCEAVLCFEGFYLNFGGVARGCGAHNCTVGVLGFQRNTVIDCNLTFCTDGITLGEASRVTGCHVGGGSGHGVSVSHGSTVERCTVNGQGLIGIIAADRCSITDNRVEFCGGNGVYVGGNNTMVVGNIVQRCVLDVGVFIEGNDNQLEMNRVEGSGQEGIKMFGERNLVIRNRVCSSGRILPGAFLDYNFAVGNFVGTVLLPGAFATTTETNANFACGFIPGDPATGARPAGPGAGTRGASPPAPPAPLPPPAAGVHPGRPAGPAVPAAR